MTSMKRQEKKMSPVHVINYDAVTIAMNEYTLMHLWHHTSYWVWYIAQILKKIITNLSRGVFRLEFRGALNFCCKMRNFVCSEKRCLQIQIFIKHLNYV